MHCRSGVWRYKTAGRDDVAAVLAAVLAHEDTAGRTFELVAGEEPVERALGAFVEARGKAHAASPRRRSAPAACEELKPVDEAGRLTPFSKTAQRWTLSASTWPNWLLRSASSEP